MLDVVHTISHVHSSLRKMTEQKSQHRYSSATHYDQAHWLEEKSHQDQEPVQL
jgi:hypothetical protein